MSVPSVFTCGVDFSALPVLTTNFGSAQGFTASHLTQAVSQAAFTSPYGAVVTQSTPPNVATYPTLANFIWVESTTGIPYRWNGSAWVVFTQPDLDGSYLLDDSVPLSAISFNVGDAGKILYISTTGVAAGNLASFVQDNSLPFAKVQPPAVAGLVPVSQGTSWAFQPMPTASSVLGGMSPQSISLSLLKGSVNGKYLKVDSGSITEADLPSGGPTIPTPSSPTDDGKLITVAAGGAYQLSTPAAFPIVTSKTTTAATLPTTASTNSSTLTVAASAPGTVTENSEYIAFEHGLGAVPHIVDVRLQCISAANGYAVGECADIRCVTSSGGDNEDPYYITRRTPTHILIYRTNRSNPQLKAHNNSGIEDAGSDFDPTKWKAQIACMKIV